MCDPVDSSSGFRRRKKLGKKAETFFPYESYLTDDLVIDILSRLPAKDVLRSRCVCRRWRDVTSTKDFIDLHMGRCISMIVKDYNGSDSTLLDRCWEVAQTRSKIHKVYKPDHRCILVSNSGLIAARGNASGEDFIIYNPIYRDVVKISFPLKPLKGCIYAVFFHPVEKEHCILWAECPIGNPFRVLYKIINLESDTKCRDIRNVPTNLSLTDRIYGIQSVLLDKYLYWIAEPGNRDFFADSTFNCDMVEYDIGKEELRLIPCPVPVSVKHNEFNVNLIDIDGMVSLVQVLPSKESVEINVWILKDSGEQVWTCSNYKVSSDVYPPKYEVLKAIAFRNGELVVQSDGRLYVCNLISGTYRKFGKKYKYNPHVKFLSHVPSLVSLKNCRPNICVKEEDEH